MKHTSGCPSCGSDRLKKAPIPLLSLAVEPLVRRRRYQCGDCKWVGWKRRLRRSTRTVNGSIQAGNSTDRKAILFSVAVLTMMTVASGMLITSCERVERPAQNSVTTGP